jgi:glutamate dehydrogenase (NADP+)
VHPKPTDVEMRKNATHNEWSFEDTLRRRAATMADAHIACLATAGDYGVPGKHVVGQTSQASST